MTSGKEGEDRRDRKDIPDVRSWSEIDLEKWAPRGWKERYYHVGRMNHITGVVA